MGRGPQNQIPGKQIDREELQVGAKEYEWVDAMEFARPLPWTEVTECR